MCIAPAGPSWLALIEIRVSKTESRFAAYLNGLLQQNLPEAEVEQSSPVRRCGEGR
jgi:hypothetical protein